MRGSREPPVELLKLVIERTEYLRTLEESGEGDAADRRANVEELLAAALAYTPVEGAEGVAGFLAESALITDADRLEEGRGPRAAADRAQREGAGVQGGGDRPGSRRGCSRTPRRWRRRASWRRSGGSSTWRSPAPRNRCCSPPRPIAGA